MPKAPMDNREIIVSKLAQWGMTLTDEEVETLLPAYETLLEWQKAVHDMVHGRTISRGMTIPESQPILTHATENAIANAIAEQKG